MVMIMMISMMIMVMLLLLLRIIMPCTMAPIMMWLRITISLLELWNRTVPFGKKIGTLTDNLKKEESHKTELNRLNHHHPTTTMQNKKKTPRVKNPNKRNGDPIRVRVDVSLDPMENIYHLRNEVRRVLLLTEVIRTPMLLLEVAVAITTTVINSTHKNPNPKKEEDPKRRTPLPLLLIRNQPKTETPNPKMEISRSKQI
mmetsp:Transcript_13195/g.19047  ORF Transcript_13195/g.19047 Transcript_13195/m.19047 type:complete len:200 (-) Transcript_13195:169-768(-)